MKLMMQVVDIWKKFSHPNCVALREVFTTKAFGDNSLILVYDYHVGSQTLLSKYFTPTTNGYTGYSQSVGSAFSGDARPFSHKNTLQRTGMHKMTYDLHRVTIEISKLKNGTFLNFC